MDILREFYNARPSEPDPAKKILFTVFNDLITRVDFSDFWHSCSEEVQDEILRKNLEKIKRVLD